MTPNLELPDALYQEIKRLCEDGDDLASDGDHVEAIAEYHKAWLLVPEPKTDWNASTWILAALADAFFFTANWQQARRALSYAMHCPGALGNPFLHLRFGQVLFELGELDKAADELIRAYMGGGKKSFEKDDPKYLAFLGTRAIL